MNICVEFEPFACQSALNSSPSHARASSLHARSLLLALLIAPAAAHRAGPTHTETAACHVHAAGARLPLFPPQAPCG